MSWNITCYYRGVYYDFAVLNDPDILLCDADFNKVIADIACTVFIRLFAAVIRFALYIFPLFKFFCEHFVFLINIDSETESTAADCIFTAAGRCQPSCISCWWKLRIQHIAYELRYRIIRDPCISWLVYMEHLIKPVRSDSIIPYWIPEVDLEAEILLAVFAFVEQNLAGRYDLRRFVEWGTPVLERILASCYRFKDRFSQHLCINWVSDDFLYDPELSVRFIDVSILGRFVSDRILYHLKLFELPLE